MSCVLKKSNCGNAIAEIEKKRKNIFGNCGNDIAKNGKKIEWNYGNVIAENGRKKKILLPKSGKKLKKKKMLRSQYFYNTFTTNHR